MKKSHRIPLWAIIAAVFVAAFTGAVVAIIAVRQVDNWEEQQRREINPLQEATRDL